MVRKLGYIKGMLTGGAFGVVLGMYLNELKINKNFYLNSANKDTQKCYNEDID